MTLMVLFVVIVVIIGGWALFCIGRLLNVRQTQPSILLLVRVLFIVSVVVMGLIKLGAIPDIFTRL